VYSATHGWIRHDAARRVRIDLSVPPRSLRAVESRARNQRGETQRVHTTPDVEGDDCLLDRTPGQVARGLRALDWDFQNTRKDDSAHSLHPYPAKFVPQLARQAILTLSLPGEVVLDPFSGGGTTAVEAAATGRHCLAIDANPVGNAITQAKVTPLSTADTRALKHLEATLLAFQRSDLTACSNVWLPSIPKVEKWYRNDIFRALGLINAQIVALERQRARALAQVAFIHAAARLSFQDSETRYASRPREMDLLDAPRAVIAELRRMRRLAQRTSAPTAERIRIVEGDSRDPASFELTPGSAGLVITSPPYPNAYDYHLYHRFRLFWLGRDPAELRRVEIGSHLKGQAHDHPTEAYLVDLRAVLENCFNALAPGRYAVVVVGDGMFGGEIFDTAEQLRRLGETAGYDHVVTLERKLPVHRRSITHAGRRLAEEQLVVLRRPHATPKTRVIDPNYTLFPYERELRTRELRDLGGSPRHHEHGEEAVVFAPELRHAAFCHGFEHHAGGHSASLQQLLEGSPSTGARRKNSTYCAHGIHRYKGKFYPQLAKSLLNLSGLQPGRSLVLDPFGGSGTMALEAVIGGIDALSVDCNPLATAITQAKLSLASAPSDRVLAAAKKIRAKVKAGPAKGSRSFTQFAPTTLPELERWFADPVLYKLDWLLATVRSADASVAGFFEILVSNIIREISHQEPKDLRIRRRSAPLDDADVYARFLACLDLALTQLEAFWRDVRPALGQLGRGRAIQSNSAEAATFTAALDGRSIDAVISSPPYAAALPYIDTDRLSLAALFGLPTSERKTLEDRMIGSREITERQRKTLEEALENCDTLTLPDSTVTFLREYGAAVAGDRKAGFRLRQTPAVLLRYFRSMSEVLGALHPHMSSGASCWLVLGDSHSTAKGRRWKVPTVDEVTAIAQLHGFRLIERIPITVTREDRLHARNAITRNEIVRLQA
jgi:DNA modification methylase